MTSAQFQTIVKYLSFHEFFNCTRNSQVDDIVDMLGDELYRWHHVSVRHGYLPKKVRGRFKEYYGSFGYGYILIEPVKDSTNTVTYTYFIKDSK